MKFHWTSQCFYLPLPSQFILNLAQAVHRNNEVQRYLTLPQTFVYCVNTDSWNFTFSSLSLAMLCFWFKHYKVRDVTSALICDAFTVECFWSVSTIFLSWLVKYSFQRALICITDRSIKKFTVVNLKINKELSSSIYSSKHYCCNLS